MNSKNAWMLVGLGLVLSAPETASAADLQSILGEAHAAARRAAWSELDGDLAFSGEAHIYGVASGFELFFSPEGRYRFRTDGPLASDLGWDGEQAWTRERQGPARRTGPEERAWTQLGQWVHSGYWVEAELEIRLVDGASNPALLSIALPGLAAPCELALDAETWLPVELRRDLHGREVSVSYADYREVEGILIAHSVRNNSGGEQGQVDIERGARAARPGARGERYGFPVGPPADTSFVPEIGAEIEIQRVRTGHLLVHPLVDGQDVGWFVFDTGAGQICIDPGVADELEQPALGSVPAIGVAGSIVTKFRQGQTLELGPLMIQDPVYVELDLAFLEPAFGVPVAGICGYDVFARSTVELELEGPSASIHDPARYELEQGAWIELTLEDRIPAIECGFEGDRSGLFKIDTGAAGTVAFHTAAVEALGLLEGRELRAGQVGGVGGSGQASFGQMEWFDLGGRRFEDISVGFDQGGKGGQAETSVLGTLGSKLFQPFQIVFDYTGNRIALVPR